MLDPFRNLLQNNTNSSNSNLELILRIVVVIIAFIGLLYTIKRFYLDKKAIKKEKERLGVKITKISAKPWVGNGAGGWESYCYIDIEVRNPSDRNEIIAMIKHPTSFDIIAEIKNKNLPAFQTTPFKIEFSHTEFNSEEKINTIKGKELLLMIRDIHGKEVNQYFTFENIP